MAEHTELSENWAKKSELGIHTQKKYTDPKESCL